MLPYKQFSDSIETKFELSLRNAVIRFFEVGDYDSLTLKRVREAAAVRLNTTVDVFTLNPRWIALSKEIIHDEIVSCPSFVHF